MDSHQREYDRQQSRTPSEHSSASRRRSLGRAAHHLVHASEERLRRLQQKESVNGLDRETQHFVTTTTLHGPKRIYFGKRIAGWLWAVWMSASTALFIYQVYTLVSTHVARPVLSDVSFHLAEKGLRFPDVTLCNFNPIRKSHIMELNKTGEFPSLLLNYLLATNLDVSSLYMDTNETELLMGEEALEDFRFAHPNFTFTNFYSDSGFKCEDLLKICSFGGRRFNCCDYARPIITDLGRCYQLNMMHADQVWLRRQVTSGVGGGLQLIAHSHREEEYDDIANDTTSQFGQTLENGFRYHVHNHDTIPHIAVEGISASPGSRVYSALTANKYSLLREDEWGNCRDSWPAGYNTTLAYTGAACVSLCRARYFEEVCGCVPAIYRVDSNHLVCSPYTLFRCLRDKFDDDETNAENIRLPECAECKLECKTWTYQTYNSYGNGFRNGAVNWISKEVPGWRKHQVRKNVVAINIFYKDLAYTEYTETQGSSITEMLSNIGGNMGMCLGMSLITCMEICLYFAKLWWIGVSRQRRRYMDAKKKKEKTRKERLEQTVYSNDVDVNSEKNQHALSPELINFCTNVMAQYNAEHGKGGRPDTLEPSRLHTFYANIPDVCVTNERDERVNL